MKASSVITNAQDISKLLHERHNNDNLDPEEVDTNNISNQHHQSVSTNTTSNQSSSISSSVVIRTAQEWRNVPIIVAKSIFRMDKKVNMMATSMQQVADVLGKMTLLQQQNLQQTQLHLFEQQQQRQENETAESRTGGLSDREKKFLLDQQEMIKQEASSPSNRKVKKNKVDRNDDDDDDDDTETLVEHLLNIVLTNNETDDATNNNKNKNHTQKRKQKITMSAISSSPVDPLNEPSPHSRGDNSLIHVSERTRESNNSPQKNSKNQKHSRKFDADDLVLLHQDISISDISNEQEDEKKDIKHNQNEEIVEGTQVYSPSTYRKRKGDFFYVTSNEARNVQHVIPNVSLFGLQGPRGGILGQQEDQTDGDTFYRFHSAEFRIWEDFSRKRGGMKPEDIRRRQEEFAQEEQGSRKREARNLSERRRKAVLKDADREEDEKRKRPATSTTMSSSSVSPPRRINISDDKKKEETPAIKKEKKVSHQAQQQHEEEPVAENNENVEKNVVPEYSPRTKAHLRGSDWLKQIQHQLETSSSAPSSSSNNSNKSQKEEEEAVAEDKDQESEHNDEEKKPEAKQTQSIQKEQQQQMTNDEQEIDTIDPEMQKRIDFLNSISFRRTHSTNATGKCKQISFSAKTTAAVNIVPLPSQSTCRWKECTDRLNDPHRQETVICGINNNNKNKTKLWHMKNPPNNDDPNDCHPAYQTSLRKFNDGEEEYLANLREKKKFEENLRREKEIEKELITRQLEAKERRRLLKERDEKTERDREEEERMRREKYQREKEIRERELQSSWRRRQCQQHQRSQIEISPSARQRHDEKVEKEEEGSDGVVQTPRPKNRPSNEENFIPAQIKKNEDEQLDQKAPILQQSPPLPNYRSWIFRSTGEIISAKKSSVFAPCTVREQDFAILHSLSNDEALQEKWKRERKDSTCCNGIKIRNDNHQKIPVERSACCSKCFKNIDSCAAHRRSPYLIEPSIANPRSERPIQNNDIRSKHDKNTDDDSFILRWCGFGGDQHQRASFVLVSSASSCVDSQATLHRTRIVFFRPHVQIRADRHVGVVSKFDLSNACWNICVLVNGEVRTNLAATPIQSLLARTKNDNCNNTSDDDWKIDNEFESPPYSFYFSCCVDLDLFQGDLVSFRFSRTTVAAETQEIGMNNNKGAHTSYHCGNKHLDRVVSPLKNPEEEFADLWYLQFSSRR